MTKLKCIFCNKKIKDYWALQRHLDTNHHKEIVKEWLEYNLGKFWDEGRGISEKM